MPTDFSVQEDVVMPTLLIKISIDLFNRYTKSTGYNRASTDSLADSAPKHLPSLAPEGMFRNFLCSRFYDHKTLCRYLWVMNCLHVSAVQRHAFKCSDKLENCPSHTLHTQEPHLEDIFALLEISPWPSDVYKKVVLLVWKIGSSLAVHPMCSFPNFRLECN